MCMVILKLTYTEWYFLVGQLQKMSKEHKYNLLPKRILENLMDNKPHIKNAIDFKKEYECKWGD